MSHLGSLELYQLVQSIQDMPPCAQHGRTWRRVCTECRATFCFECDPDGCLCTMGG